eukprot:TRINITY_DN27879_c0_g1_i1.p2 TRINITY_DN27879_c0_g1~~TRINITY_DN27879_c0_g1_i1.p2  ORF type:complete len:412 (+),score=206.74 TRINITY_DN27879_c0_g1_i1:49-1284(+)
MPVNAQDVALGAVLGGGLVAMLCGNKRQHSRQQQQQITNDCPATQWPTENRTWTSGKPINYPTYDMSKPKESFMAVREFLKHDLCTDCREGYELPPTEVKWIEDMLSYNLEGGKMNRGLMVVESGVAIFKAKKIPITNEVLCRFAIVGWCIEYLQAFFLITDDIMDDSVTRRGQPCWYRQKHVGMIAINDGITMEMCLYKILKRHFAGETYYLQLLDLFMETTFQTEMGQLLDTLCANLDLTDFTTTRWELIVKYKTAFYSFYCSVAAGMIMSGITNVKEYNLAREILIIMGVYFQAQDDFLDCYGTPEEIGKIGTDIQDKKCGWLFVHAFGHRCSLEEKKVFWDHYGKCKVQTPQEQRIKDIYTAVGMKEFYAKYEQDSYDRIMALKDDSSEVPWEVFETFLKKVYRRKK